MIRTACSIRAMLVVAWLVATTNMVTAADFGPVVLLGQPTSSSYRLFGFETDGSQEDELVLSPGETGNQFPTSLATNGRDVFVGDFTAGILTKYSRDGDFLGTLAPLTDAQLGDGGIHGIIETDAAGSLYAAKRGNVSKPRTSLRLDASGTVTGTFAHPDLIFPGGIDADAHGNVYIVNSANIGVGDQLFKFSPTGTYLGMISLGALSSPSDLAIDEANQIAYISDQAGGPQAVAAYDLSDLLPSFLGKLSTPSTSLLGLSYSDATGHLYLAGKGSSGVGYELATDGTLLATFETQPNAMYVARDVVYLVPEPASAALLFLGLAALFYCRART